MSSSSNCSTVRRRLVAGLALWPLAVGAAPDPLPAGVRRWGSGPFRRFGLLIYEATLWAAEDPLKAPLQLRLDYHRTLSGQRIAEASVDEMRRQAVDESRLPAWGAAMRRIFPDVQAGDHLVGQWLPGGAHFLQGDRSLGSIEDEAFARAFFGIWLDPRTSAPALRAALLQRAAG